MSRYAGGYYSRMDVGCVRYGKMLRWSYITKKIRTSRSRDSTTYGRGYVIIAGSDICSERSQQIERSPVTKLFLYKYISDYLIEGHMSGPLDNHLYALGPSPSGQLAENDEFLHLRPICGIHHGARPKTITQTQGNVVFKGYFEKSIEIFIEGILFVVLLHPVHKD